MTAPVQTSPDPAELWDYLVGKGVSEADATRHVLRMLQNVPAEVRRQYLKDVDPGALASFGLGAADMMSFGLGKQVAGALDRAAPESDRSYSALTEEAAQANHPTAHFAGEVTGLVGPAAAEFGLAKAGLLVPTALGRLVQGITSRPARAAAKTALNAAIGAGYAGAQAAGRTEGSLGERAKAASQAAPYGAVAGAVLPLAVAGAKATVGPTINRFMDAVAGKGPSGLLAPEAVPSATEALRAQYLKAGVAPENVAAQMARDAAGPPGLLVPSPARPPGPAVGPPSMRTTTPDPLATPTFQRRGLLNAEPVPEAWQGTTPQAGGVGGHSYSGTYPRPDVPPVVTNAAPAAAALRKVSYTQLQEVLRAPETPKVLKDLILAEIQRRGITGPGLLAPR